MVRTRCRSGASRNCAGASSLPVSALRNTTPPPSVAIHSPSSLATSEEIQPFGSVLGVAAIVAQLAEFVAVEAVESVLGAEPHEAFAVLHDGVHGLLRQTFLEAVALHAERRSRETRIRKRRTASAAIATRANLLTCRIFPRVIDIVLRQRTTPARIVVAGARALCDWRRMRRARRPAVERYHTISVMRITGAYEAWLDPVRGGNARSPRRRGARATEPFTSRPCLRESQMRQIRMRCCRRRRSRRRRVRRRARAGIAPSPRRAGWVWSACRRADRRSSATPVEITWSKPSCRPNSGT